MKLIQVAIAFDQFVNTLFNGYADETLSARAFRYSSHKRWSFAMKFIDLLFFWQDKHCYQAYLSEKERKHLPDDYRT